jgi:hypothetical protein
MLATIAAFRDPWEAHMFRLRLEAEDVPAVVAYDFHIGNNWLWSTALGGVRVQVPHDFADAAFDVKSLCRNGEISRRPDRRIWRHRRPALPALRIAELLEATPHLRRDFFRRPFAARRLPGVGLGLFLPKLRNEIRIVVARTLALRVPRSDVG